MGDNRGKVPKKRLKLQVGFQIAHVGIVKEFHDDDIRDGLDCVRCNFYSLKLTFF